jgi:hypothetical protein
LEALAHSLGDSISSLELERCTLLSSFWAALVHRLPKLQHLTLGALIASVFDLTLFLGVRSQSSPDTLTISMRGVLQGLEELGAVIAAWQLQNMRFEIV